MALTADWWPPSIATGSDGTLSYVEMDRQRQGHPPRKGERGGGGLAEKEREREKKRGLAEYARIGLRSVGL